MKITYLATVCLLLAIQALAQNTTEAPGTTTVYNTTIPPTTQNPDVSSSPAGEVTTSEPEYHWEIKNDDGKICMLAKMQTKFDIQYVKSDDSKAKIEVDLPSDADASESVCGNFTSKLVLTFFDNTWSVTMNFTKDADNKNYYMNRYILGYVYDEKFEEPKEKDKSVNAIREEEDFKTSVGKSYQCDWSTNIEINDNVTMDMSDFKIQPFALEAEEDWGDAVKCPADVVNDNLLAITLGCCLAGLIIIVVIAYFIGRYRKRKAYTNI